MTTFPRKSLALGAVIALGFVLPGAGLTASASTPVDPSPEPAATLTAADAAQGEPTGAAPTALATAVPITVAPPSSSASSGPVVLDCQGIPVPQKSPGSVEPDGTRVTTDQTTVCESAAPTSDSSDSQDRIVPPLPPTDNVDQPDPGSTVIAVPPTDLSGLLAQIINFLMAFLQKLLSLFSLIPVF